MSRLDVPSTAASQPKPGCDSTSEVHTPNVASSPAAPPREEGDFPGDAGRESREATPLSLHHKRTSSPTNSALRRNVRPRVEISSPSAKAQELLDKKPLSASAALPVYCKLILALEEARLSDCLTAPMAIELERLTSRCKQTGNAIIQKLPLPPEDQVHIILDDEEEDLVNKYGLSLQLFDSLERNRDPHHDPENGSSVQTGNPRLKAAGANRGTHEVLSNGGEKLDDVQNEAPEPGCLDSATCMRLASPTKPSPALSIPEPEGTDCQPKNSQPEPSYLKNASVLSCNLEDVDCSDSNCPRLEPEPRSPVSDRPEFGFQTLEHQDATDTSHVSESTTKKRVLRTRVQKKMPEAMPTLSGSRRSPRALTPPVPKKNKRVSQTERLKGKAREHNSTDTEAEGNEDPKFFLGSPLMETELKELLSPYASHQTSKIAKLKAWEALTSLLRRRRLGEPLDQEFLDGIDGGTQNVVVKTRFNAQTWFEAIEITMPQLFNSHAGEPAHALGFFNTMRAKKESLADKVPEGLPVFWHQTWRSMRMSVRPSPAKVTSFLKILLDSVLLTGRTFLKEPPVSEQEKAMTGVQAVCQAIKWLNSQKTPKTEHSKTVRFLEANNLTSAIDIGLIQQWQDLFIKVLDSYVVQHFEANYILNEEASPEDKAVAARFKKDWKGDSIKSPTLGYLTMFACCGIRGLICCSNDVNVTPAGQMLSFTVLSEWLCQRKANFKVREPTFKRSNQMLMKLIDGIFDEDGHFVKPEITWYEVAKNLCFDYLSHWFEEGGDMAEGGGLVFPNSSFFSGKDQTVTFSEAS
ncbi:hypothetical protein DFH28DRAFT_907300 [Melampsora americana]|nr:hypothetical protein DFH28DRAFT_907300 [Melampsora americana]